SPATWRRPCVRRSPSIARSCWCRRRWACRPRRRASSRVRAPRPTTWTASTRPPPARTRPPRRDKAPMSKRVAVTGVTGFVGPHLVAALARRGFRLRLLVRRWSPLPSLDGIAADMVLGDLSDEAALKRLVEGADAVVHAAGLIKARLPSDFMTVNRDGTALL